MSYRVEITERASRDLEEILRTLWERSPDAVRRLSLRFEQTLSRLENHPLSCGLAFENPQLTEELRHALFGNHPKRKCRALFVVRGETVVILTIRAPGTKPWKPEEIDRP